MKLKLSLVQRFAFLLSVFVGITVVVLYLLVAAQNVPIAFGKQELIGNEYQKPIENVLRALMHHRILAQRALNGEVASQSKLPELQAAIDTAFQELDRVDQRLGEALQFTDEGLHSRGRDHFRVANVSKEWSDLKSKVATLKPSESNEQHAHLIADLRTMITHLGDTSNLVLDPDLDSYYLMDITLLALPQSQDRIQTVMVELEPIFRRQSVTQEEQVKAAVLAALMNESDSERIKADFQTSLNEDAKSSAKSPTLESKATPVHQTFLSSHKEFIGIVNDLAAGKLVPVEKFNEVGERALAASFDYWTVASGELDVLLSQRIDSIQKTKIQQAIISVFGLFLALGLAFVFMRYLMLNMRSIVKVLESSSDQVSGASKKSASSATTLSEASTEQAASLQETMASVEEISAMVSQNAESALRTKEAVDANQKVAEDGSRSVDEMMVAINEIKETNEQILNQMESSNKEFGEIVKIISEIGAKTNVINEIVFQTKLLSFNASVEAARAGEHGKGFAVVAEEVGNLAQMSGNAAKEITDMLSDSIKRVNAIVDNTKGRVDQLVEIGKDKVIMGQSTAQKCRGSLNKITENARSVASMIAEITHASKEQAQGIQEINKAISQLDQVTQQNSSVAQQSSAQAEHLSSEARVLSSAVTKLVVFIDGKLRAETSGEMSHLTSHDRDSFAQNGPARSGSSERKFSGGKVVHMKPSVTPPKPLTVETSPSVHPESAQVSKKVVGGSAVPSANDPNFEEF